jgi:hypothetical protein
LAWLINLLRWYCWKAAMTDWTVGYVSLVTFRL